MMAADEIFESQFDYHERTNAMKMGTQKKEPLKV